VCVCVTYRWAIFLVIPTFLSSWYIIITFSCWYIALWSSLFLSFIAVRLIFLHCLSYSLLYLHLIHIGCLSFFSVYIFSIFSFLLFIGHSFPLFPPPIVISSSSTFKSSFIISVTHTFSIFLINTPHSHLLFRYFHYHIFILFILHMLSFAIFFHIHFFDIFIIIISSLLLISSSLPRFNNMPLLPLNIIIFILFLSSFHYTVYIVWYHIYFLHYFCHYFFSLVIFHWDTYFSLSSISPFIFIFAHIIFSVLLFITSYIHITAFHSCLLRLLLCLPVPPAVGCLLSAFAMLSLFMLVVAAAFRLVRLASSAGAIARRRRCYGSSCCLLFAGYCQQPSLLALLLASWRLRHKPVFR